MIILYIILGLIAVLLAVLLLNTVFQTHRARKLVGEHPTLLTRR